MTVSYKGMDEGMEYRLAEIEFLEKEEAKVERIMNLMRIKGWDVYIVTDEYGQCVVEDMSEFKMFMKDWKEAKKCITDCMKFGF